MGSVCTVAYAPQVTQHCLWTERMEQRPSSFSLSQKREEMLFFLHGTTETETGRDVQKKSSEKNYVGPTVDVDSSIQPTLSEQSHIDRYLLKEGGVSNI